MPAISTYKQPSPYFVTITDNRDDWLDIIIQTVSYEKYWNLYRGSVLTTGISHDFTTQGRNTITLYTTLSFRIIDRVQFVVGTSWGRDNKRTDYITASSFLSFGF